MFWRTLRKRIRQVVCGAPWRDARYAALLLIVLLTLLMILGHALELNIAPLLVLVCFLALAAMTGGVIACVFSQHAGRS
jgi:hypothetical protein